jgi:hypothetical protein
MRLDRLLPLSTPVPQPGRKDERPPRRQPETPELRRDASEPPPADDGAGDRPTPSDHLDITV